MGPWRRPRGSVIVPAFLVWVAANRLYSGFALLAKPNSFGRESVETGRPLGRTATHASSARAIAQGGNLLEGERFVAMNRFRVKDGLEEQFEQRWGNDRSISSLQGLRWFCLLRRVSSTPKSTGALSVVFDSDDEQFEDDYTYVSLGVWENQEAFSGAGGMLQEAGEDSASFASMAFKGVVTTSGAPKPALWDGMLLEKAKAMQNSKAAPFIVMNRFVVKAGSEVEFEERWANRESKLLEADGFQFFQLLRRVKTPDDDVNYISMSAWADRGAFDKWWEGKSFANMAQVQGNLLESEIVRYFYEGVLVVEGDKGL